jgi:hypothetical protein
MIFINWPSVLQRIAARISGAATDALCAAKRISQCGTDPAPAGEGNTHAKEEGRK